MNQAPYARLYTIGEIARERGVSWWTMWRLLKRLWADDLAREEKRRWFFRHNEDSTVKNLRGQWRVNRGLLKKVHPELFEHREAVLHDLTERVERLERNDADFKRRQNGLAAALRRHVALCRVEQGT